jgi:5'-nucleotidase
MRVQRNEGRIRVAIDFTNTLVVGISASALFDLSEADEVFRKQGIHAYREYMLEGEREPLAPGTGYALVKALLGLNTKPRELQGPATEVVVMSRNSPETGVRIMNAVEQHNLPISRFAFTGGEALAGYVPAFRLDLFLSTNESDVQRVADADACASAVLYPLPADYQPADDHVRVAFDADAVLFDEASERVYQSGGLPAFHAAEREARDTPMEDGPFAEFLRKLARLKESLPEGVEYSPVRIAVVTARNAPAQARVITTLRAWGVYVDSAFFMGGLPKDEVLRVLRPHIFFDDQLVHVLPASGVAPSGRVPYRSSSPLFKGETAQIAGDALLVTRSPADVAVPGDA